MEEVKLIKGPVKEHFNKDIYWQKSSIEFAPPEHKLISVIVLVSYEYIADNLKLDYYNDIQKITDWINGETDKLFEQYKMSPNNMSESLIVRQFTISPVSNVDALLEEIG
jgi:hypothetical protein